PGERVGLDIHDVRRREAASREVEILAAEIDSHDLRAAASGEIVCQLALAAADVEHTLARPHAFDEEIVVVRNSMLHVDAAAVVDSVLAGDLFDVPPGVSELLHSRLR